MKRNITKMAAEGKKILSENVRCDLNTGEMNELYKIYRNAKDGERLWLLMLTAFQFGTANGYRIAKREVKKALAET